MTFHSAAARQASTAEAFSYVLQRTLSAQISSDVAFTQRIEVELFKPACYKIKGGFLWLLALHRSSDFLISKFLDGV
jgi:hypothetical protein